jgi:hypothetical protein
MIERLIARLDTANGDADFEDNGDLDPITAAGRA